MMTKATRKLLLVDRYQSATGPVIIIYGPLDADFESLASLFESLGTSEDQSIELCLQPFISCRNSIRLQLANTAPFGVFSEDNSSASPGVAVSLLWRCVAGEWQDRAIQIRTLCVDKFPSHQYLAKDPGSKSVLVASRGEYDSKYA